MAKETKLSKSQFALVKDLQDGKKICKHTMNPYSYYYDGQIPPKSIQRTTGNTLIDRGLAILVDDSVRRHLNGKILQLTEKGKGYTQ